MEPGQSNSVACTGPAQRPRRRIRRRLRRYSDGATDQRIDFATLLQSVYPDMNTIGRPLSWLDDNESDSPGLPTIYNVEPCLTLPSRVRMLIYMPRASLDLARRYAWNSKDCSHNIVVIGDPLTCHKLTSWSTDCVRGKLGVTRGIHIWEISWPRYQRWIQPVVGVATKDAPLHCIGTEELIGCDDQSWGWDITFSKLYHDSRNNRRLKYPACLKRFEIFYVPDKFHMVLDMDEGTLSFIVNGQYLGVAFSGLRGRKLYPIVSGTWGYCAIRLSYACGVESEPQDLMSICRLLIRERIGKYRLKERISKLRLPRPLQDYLLYKD